MGSELKKTVKHTGIYTIGIILNRAVSFVMLPIYTRFLTPSDYGVIELLGTTVEVVSIVVGLGILHGLSKFYYKYGSEEERKELVSTTFMLNIMFYLPACLIGVMMAAHVSQLVFQSEAYSFYVLISFVNLFLQFLFYIPVAYIRTQQRPVFFVVVTSISLVLQLSLNILFVVYMRMGVLGALYSTMLSSLVMGGAMTYYTFSKTGLHFSKDKAGELIRFGYPFVFSGFAAFIITFSDRYFLNYYRDPTDVGVYSLAYKFGFLLMFFPVRPIMNIWTVQRFEIVNNNDFERTFNKFFTWFCIVTLSCALLISMTVRDVLRVMSDTAFWGAHRVVPIIVLAYFFQACTDFFSFGIYHSGETKHAAYGNWVSCIVVVALSFMAIPRYGVYGAAFATLIAFAVRLAYYYIASQRLFRIGYWLLRPLATTVTAVAVYLIYLGGLMWIPGMDQMYLSSSFAVLMFVLFAASLFALNIIRPEERAMILETVRMPIRAVLRGQGG